MILSPQRWYTLICAPMWPPVIPEYCASRLRGDCGVQALTFITMCRIAGIPARWQSGLYADWRSADSHDWAMF